LFTLSLAIFGDLWCLMDGKDLLAMGGTLHREQILAAHCEPDLFATIQVRRT